MTTKVQVAPLLLFQGGTGYPSFLDPPFLANIIITVTAAIDAEYMQNKESYKKIHLPNRINKVPQITIPRTIFRFLRTIRSETGWCGFEMGDRTQIIMSLPKRKITTMALEILTKTEEKAKETRNTLLVRRKQFR